jgi:hypothetical protein
VGARTDAARAEVVAARSGLETEYDQLGQATRDALDVPARIRRAPAQSAAVAGGAAFVVLGGPRRILRRLKRAVHGEPSPLPSSMLPDEVEKAVRALGTDGDAVRGALERSFAEYLDKRGSFAQRDVRTATGEALASTIRTAGRTAGSQLVRRMLSGETAQLAGAIDQARRIIQRGTGGPVGRPDDDSPGRPGGPAGT